MMTSAQWIPSPDSVARSQIVNFAEYLCDHHGLPPEATRDYAALHRFSVTHLEAFWRGFADWAGVQFSQPPEHTLSTPTMPGARWCEGATLNFAAHIADVAPDHLALVLETEAGDEETLSYGELTSQVAACASYLTSVGVVAGDHVVGYLPTSIEGVVAFFAAASIGAVWAHAGMDYAAHTAADRLAQLNPRVLIAGTGYVHRGRTYDRTDEVAALRTLLPTVTHVVRVPTLKAASPTADTASRVDDTADWETVIREHQGAVFAPAPLDFSHPLWVLFTSGTTGTPKGLVHGHGGALLEELKSVRLHLDLGERDVFFWYTTPNWMMWNVLISGLLVGSTVLLYVGDPLYPDPSRLWQLAEKHGVTVFGTSPAQLSRSETAGVTPAAGTQLRVIASTGSPLPASANAWVRRAIGSHVQVSSVSGGTDVVGLFMGATPMNPVWDGEISAISLGVALEVWGPAGAPLIGEVGELVITRPMPSMPLYFVNDDGGSRYHDAYFNVFDGVWRHGDWVEVTDHGSVIMHGRSDATLNRNGIRLGSAEIYDAVESLAEVADSLVVGVELQDGRYWLPLFVVPGPGWAGAESEARIRDTIARRASKHHVPDEIITVTAIPRTRTGKKMEVPVKKVLQGADPREIGALKVVDHPESLTALTRFARSDAR